MIEEIGEEVIEDQVVPENMPFNNTQNQYPNQLMFNPLNTQNYPNQGMANTFNNNYPNQFVDGKKGKRIKTWIEVGAQGWDGMENLPATFSNYGEKSVHIFSPRVDIYSCIPGSEYAYFNGTSMATPIVSGLVGILKSFNPDLTTEEVYDILKSTGTKVKDSGKVGKVINPLEAIQQVQ